MRFPTISHVGMSGMQLIVREQMMQTGLTEERNGELQTFVQTSFKDYFELYRQHSRMRTWRFSNKLTRVSTHCVYQRVWIRKVLRQWG